MVEFKTCITCGKSLPLTDFGNAPSTFDGRRANCKACVKEEKRQENLNNELSKFKARELIQELRNRGYKGVLTFTQEIKL